MNELASATAAFNPLLGYFQKLGEAIRYGTSNFLAANYGLHQSRSSLNHLKYQVPVKEMPSGAEFDAAARRLTQAFNHAHQIYAALPKEDREYLKSPPASV